MLITKNPTANQTPDATLGGVAVTGATNTGHDSTLALAADGSAETKSCRWFTFQNVGGGIKSITLKIDHTSSGALSGVDASNLFFLDYSLNGGSSWINAVSRSDFTSSEGPTTFSVALSATQDITQIQVRDDIFAETLALGESASATVTISNIKLEITTQDAQVIIMGW